jgi:hypothetical protein
MTDRLGKVVRLAASGGWIDDETEANSEWQEKVRQLVQLVAEDEGAGEDARMLAKALRDEIEGIDRVS